MFANSAIVVFGTLLVKIQTYLFSHKTYEPCREKTNILVSDLVLHKLGCARAVPKVRGQHG